MNKRIDWLNHLLNFLAVILGVFLAFYINEQSRSHEKKKELRQVTSSLISDLEDDIKTYRDYHIPVNVQHSENIDSLLLSLSRGEMEAVDQQLAQLFSIENYTPTHSTYRSLESGGKLGLFEDLSTQKLMSDYYNGLTQECIAKNEAQVDFFLDEIVKTLAAHADFSTMQLKRGSDLLRLQNQLLFYQALISQKTDHYQMIVEDAEALKEALAALQGG